MRPESHQSPTTDCRCGNRPRRPGDGGKTAALLDLYFAMVSESGTLPIEAMQDWLRPSGLEPLKPIWLRTLLGGALVSGRRAAGTMSPK